MNKKIVIGTIAAILIIALGIFVGSKIVGNNNESNPTSNTDVNTETPTPTEPMPSPVETESPTPIPENTPTPLNPNDYPNKEEYAKAIVKRDWEARKNQKKVYYAYDDVNSEGKHIVSVRDSGTTAALAWYEVDINKGTCEQYE